jgi:hypothetical protein
MSMYMRTQASTGFTDQSFRPLKETQAPAPCTGMKTDLVLYKMIRVIRMWRYKAVWLIGNYQNTESGYVYV